MTRLLSFLSCLAATLMISNAAWAQDGSQEHVVVHAGLFDVINNDSTSNVVGAEYRLGRIDDGVLNDVRPAIGFFVSDDESAYGYVGGYWEFDIAENWTFSPYGGIGFYKQGDGKALGQSFEFLTGIETAYQLNSGAQIGAKLYHLSNAGTGDFNPGAEILAVHYAHPVDLF